MLVCPFIFFCISNLPSRTNKRIITLLRTLQTGLVKSKFVEAIQNYQEVERQFRQKYKQRMERQFRIVKPDATPDEVKAVVNSEGGGNQIFQQAVRTLACSSTGSVKCKGLICERYS